MLLLLYVLPLSAPHPCILWVLVDDNHHPRMFTLPMFVCIAPSPLWYHFAHHLVHLCHFGLDQQHQHAPKVPLLTLVTLANIKTQNYVYRVGGKEARC